MVGNASTIIIAAQECNKVFTLESITMMLVIFFMFVAVGVSICIQQNKYFEEFVKKRDKAWNGSQNSTGNKD